MVSHKFVKFDVDMKLAELSLAEKLTLLGGKVRLAQLPPYAQTTELTLVVSPTGLLDL